MAERATGFPQPVPLPAAQRRYRYSTPEGFLLGTLLLLGVVFVFAVPLGAGWDEETHLIRAWEIASLQFVPNRVPRNQLPFPAIYWNLSYRRQALIRPVAPGFWERYGGLPLDADGYIYSELETRSVYSPALLLPHAFGIRYLGHARNLPALTVFYASRMLGLFSYTLLAWLAVRLIPNGKWILALLAITPTAVFQAATVSVDPISNGLGLLFIGGTLAIAARPRIAWKDWVALVALAALLFQAKVNTAALVVLPLLLIPRSRFAMRGGKLGLIAAVLLLALLEVGGWAALAYPYLGARPSGSEPVQQLAYLSTHPLAAVVVVFSDLLRNGSSYAGQWVAEFGYEYWLVPWPAAALYVLAILLAVLHTQGEPALPVRTRIALAVSFAVGYLATVLSLYLAITPVGSEAISGVQGRYFASAAPLPLLALGGLGVQRRLVALPGWVLASAVASFVLYATGLVLSYHVLCGTAYFEPGLCYQPVYKNWAPNARYLPPLQGSTVVSQEFRAECDGLAEVRVWLDAGQAAPGTATQFTLVEPGDERALASERVPNESLPAKGWYSLDLEPDWESTGKRYLLKIEAVGGTTAAGTRLARTIRHEYREGKLLEGATPAGYDLVFRYGCVAGIERLTSGER